MMKIRKICACGLDFFTYPSVNAKYCNRGCFNKYGNFTRFQKGHSVPIEWRENLKKVLTKPKKLKTKKIKNNTETIICECGKSFNCYKSRKRKHCSRKCTHQYRTHSKKDINYIIKKCKCCNVYFKSYISFNQVFCSLKCKQKRCNYNHLKKMCFKKGHTPHNKGRYGYTNKGSFKKGHVPFEIKNYKSRYKITEYKNCTLKSSWELYFAEQLDKFNIKWVYEPERFYLKQLKRYYIPDFYLPELDLWVEIKGYLYKISAQKIKYFMKSHNNFLMIRASNKKTYTFFENVDKFIVQNK